MESHNIKRRERFFSAIHDAMESTMTSITTSVYSKRLALGSGVVGDGVTYPVENSGFGNRC